ARNRPGGDYGAVTVDLDAALPVESERGNFGDNGKVRYGGLRSQFPRDLGGAERAVEGNFGEGPAGRYVDRADLRNQEQRGDKSTAFRIFRGREKAQVAEANTTRPGVRNPHQAPGISCR